MEERLCNATNARLISHNGPQVFIRDNKLLYRELSSSRKVFKNKSKLKEIVSIKCLIKVHGQFCYKRCSLEKFGYETKIRPGMLYGII